ncbi:MAG: glyoxalase [Limnothrix sp. RL_2_0]|nr:glyoxalase [Limnothrix sp. RL_2_0]
MGDRLLFHLAIPITNIDQAMDFYAKALGCRVGRSNPGAIIFEFYGHQLVAHMTKIELQPQVGVYPRHFGMVFLDEQDWDMTLERAKKHHLTFRHQPRVRFPGMLTEHKTFFLEDPFYNLLEFKWYCHQEAIFSGTEITEIGDRPEA